MVHYYSKYFSLLCSQVLLFLKLLLHTWYCSTDPWPGLIPCTSNFCSSLLSNLSPCSADCRISVNLFPSPLAFSFVTSNLLLSPFSYFVSALDLEFPFGFLYSFCFLARFSFLLIYLDYILFDSVNTLIMATLKFYHQNSAPVLLLN